MKLKKLSKNMGVVSNTVKDFRLVVNEFIKLTVSVYIQICLVLVFCYIGFNLEMVITYLVGNMSYKFVVKLLMSFFK